LNPLNGVFTSRSIYTLIFYDEDRNKENGTSYSATDRRLINSLTNRNCSDKATNTGKYSPEQRIQKITKEDSQMNDTQYDIQKLKPP
jgi:hypothetical protein